MQAARLLARPRLRSPKPRANLVPIDRANPKPPAPTRLAIRHDGAIVPSAHILHYRSNGLVVHLGLGRVHPEHLRHVRTATSRVLPRMPGSVALHTLTVSALR